MWKLTITLELSPELEARMCLDPEEYIISDLKLLLAPIGELISYELEEEGPEEFDEIVQRVTEAFDGKTINIPGGQLPRPLGSSYNENLNEDQKRAIENLNSWYSGVEQSTILTGGGGTGKTYTLSKWLSSLLNVQADFLSPTHGAKKVLETSLQKNSIYCEVNTIAQFLGKQPVINSETGEQEFKTVVDKEGGDLVVCDESSMIAKEDLERILSKGRKILFVGDEAQLPPVGRQ
ncbi:AAA family ATPase [Okeania sp. KiyG1]|uniref:AAA family ATPase n=1 Tax=Okeania sp. KiyG1 TaxID=2720165 RepID=UPI0019235885|nr:AAA family ATPase [Okeania sp. KiyG1]GGA13976.1 hypothetical protein CYANOKiyG1_27480 [Okeania sp. KiyG1]